MSLPRLILFCEIGVFAFLIHICGLDFTRPLAAIFAHRQVLTRGQKIAACGKPLFSRWKCLIKFKGLFHRYESFRLDKHGKQVKPGDYI